MSGYSASKKMSNDELWELLEDIPHVNSGSFAYKDPIFSGRALSYGKVCSVSPYCFGGLRKGNPRTRGNWKVNLDYKDNALDVKASKWIYTSHPERVVIKGEIPMKDGFPEVKEFLEGKEMH